MSILLEALKKSERQRQRGQAPSLHDTEASVADSPDMAQQWLPLTLMALSAVAMAWIGWQQFRVPAGLESAGATAEVVARSEAATTEEAGAATPPRDDAPESGQGGPVATPAPRATAPETDVVRPGLVTGDPRARTPVEAYSGKTGSLRSVTVLPPPQDSLSADASSERLAEATEEAETVTLEESATSARAEPAPRPRASRAGSAQSDAAEVTGPISFWELPQNVRDNLPDLRITVLVFAEQPADRFVLIGGKRLRENESVQEGVLLEEIRREGAVFTYRNYRFLVEG